MRRLVCDQVKQELMDQKAYEEGWTPVNHAPVKQLYVSAT